MGIRRKLRKILRRQDELKGIVMALADDLKASIAQIDAETTAIGTLITTLADKIKNSMSDQEVTELKAGLSTISDRLTALAVDPTNPVPPQPVSPAAPLHSLRTQ